MKIDYFRIAQIENLGYSSNQHSKISIRSAKTEAQNNFEDDCNKFILFGVDENDLPTLYEYSLLKETIYSKSTIEVYLSEVLQNKNIEQLDQEYLNLASKYNIDINSLENTENL